MRSKKRITGKKRKTMKKNILWKQFGCSLHKTARSNKKKCKKCNLFFKGGCGSCSASLVGGRRQRGGCGCSASLVGGRRQGGGNGPFVGTPWTTEADGNSNYYANVGNVIQNDPALQQMSERATGGRRRQRGGFSLIPAPLANMGSSMYSNSVNSINTLAGNSLNPSPLPYIQPSLQNMTPFK
jgi:hypothetical protein